ncbi:hypothetical protein BRADI_4g15467v3 [Brachypodium distachyon]|uniref:F-box domain-containing protein n=1 Tax=Brachypodium distachyon TaxID=15368 RepID=I1IKX3_BRADI|nr:hypothetical protein BRADI_4g15467v3 [Brachypodium distachyon]
MERASKRLKLSLSGVMPPPPDVVWEILLRVPGRSLCRFRAVCRSWRSLLSDRSFIKEHAARGPDLILAVADAGDRIDMVDLSGNVVRRIQITADGAGLLGLPRAHPGPIQLFRSNDRVRAVDPDTGAVSTLPVDALDKRQSAYWYDHGACYALGQRKVLRVVTRDNMLLERVEQLCHVLTLGEDDARPPCWRPAPSPPVCITSTVGIHNIVIGGVVYFLVDENYPDFDWAFSPEDDQVWFDINCIASFDLETEEWRPTTIPGPREINTHIDGCHFKLERLHGSLAMVHWSDSEHPDSDQSVVDVWCARDLEKGIWVKEHTIQKELLHGPAQMCISDGVGRRQDSFFLYCI